MVDTNYQDMVYTFPMEEVSHALDYVHSNMSATN